MRVWFFICLFLSACVTASDRANRESLDQVYILDKFRIFYSLEGDQALPPENQLDENHNQKPDFIERLARKFLLADWLYSRTLELTDPLQSDRYRGKVKFIDVHVMDYQDHKGVTGDKIIRYRYSEANTPSLPVIDIKLSNALQDENLTPVHELFHEYQNGYAPFKNKWYKEGLARWAEFAFAEGSGPEQPLPATDVELMALLNSSYEAKYFWNRLAGLCDSDQGVFTPSQEIVNLDQNHVIRDQRLKGYSFFKNFLENLKLAGLALAKDRGFDAYEWKNTKRDEANNPYILCAVKQSLRRHCPASINQSEVQQFLKTADQAYTLDCKRIYP